MFMNSGELTENFSLKVESNYFPLCFCCADKLGQCPSAVEEKHFREMLRRWETLASVVELCPSFCMPHQKCNRYVKTKWLCHVLGPQEHPNNLNAAANESTCEMGHETMNFTSLVWSWGPISLLCFLHGTTNS